MSFRNYEEWEKSVPRTITGDPLWRMKVYRLAHFIGELGWKDATKLYRDQRTVSIAGQLYRALGSISANISEGYSRGTGKARVQFYEYALGSSRESRGWYFHGRYVLGEDVFDHRGEILAEICRLLLTMIPAQRNLTAREEHAIYAVAHNDQESDPDSSKLQMEPDQSSPDTQYAIRNTQCYESGVVPRRGDTVMVAGEGCWMIDSEGRRYLDMTASQGVAMLGYNHPVLTAALREQAGRMHACPNFFHNDTRAAFLEQLIAVTPSHLTHAFLANSGAEAIDGAIKFTRLATGRTGIVAARGGFHGRTIGALSITWNPKYRRKFEPLLPDVSFIQFNNIEELDAAVSEGTAAVVLEVIQAEGGVHEGDADFLAAAQRLCRERGALLVIDEVQTGFGRTGRWFSFQHFGLEPDIIALAKGLGGGFPMGAIVYTDQVQESLFAGAHGSTFGGNPLACAAGVAALSVYQDGLIEQAEAAGYRLREALDAAIGGRRVVREIRGRGLIVGIDLRTKATPFLKTLMEKHRVLALPAGSTVLRLLPPLIISDDEIDLAVEAIAATLPATT